jgi:replicative DNA helicase
VSNDRIPPQNLEAEQSVLGAMMLSKDMIALVGMKLKPHHFYSHAHEAIFKVILELYQSNQPIDLITVSEALKKGDSLDQVGGRAYLAEIIDSVPTTSNAQQYADIVVDQAMLRQVIETGSDIVADGFDKTQHVDDVLERAQQKIMDLSRERVHDDFVPIKDVLMPVMDSMHDVYGADGQILGVTTGFDDLDQITSGFQKSDLIILAARPGMGKTTLALNIAVNAAIQKKHSIAVFSLEMPKEQLATRLLCGEAKIDSSRLKTANLQPREYDQLTHALGKLSEANIYLDDSPSLTPFELRAKTRRLQMEADVDLVIVDYLQLMRGGRKRSESRFQEVSEIIREVKAFARELNVPVIALSQLSRDIEKRPDQLPKLSDLRETGEIEQTADLVLFIYHDQHYESNTTANSVPSKLIIAKHRNGPVGSIDLVFRKDYSRFYGTETKAGLPV